MIYPAISLWQPYASLIFTDPALKEHETRHWRFPSRLAGERVAIHAAKRFMPAIYSNDDMTALCIEAFGEDFRHTLPAGAVIGTAVLGQCKPTERAMPASSADRLAGDWSHGRFAWELLDPRKLAKAVPFTGRQGWFSVDLQEAA